MKKGIDTMMAVNKEGGGGGRKRVFDEVTTRMRNEEYSKRV